MGRRINDLGSAEFTALFERFAHTAYRLETLPAYGVGYEDESFRAFAAGESLASDPAREEWTALIRDAAVKGKIFQRVHLVNEPLSEYLRYEMEWWYGPNAEAGDDIRILPAWRVPPSERTTLDTLRDYWLFDSRDLWVMNYDDDGRFLFAEQINDPDMIVRHTYWRDAALHYAIPYATYRHHAGTLAVS
jgi:hypothetical protein